MQKILVKAPLEEKYIMENGKEKQTLLVLPEACEEYSLAEAVEQGGSHLEGIMGLTKKENLSRVVALCTDSLEMGLMAVTYLQMDLANKASWIPADEMDLPEEWEEKPSRRREKAAAYRPAKDRPVVDRTVPVVELLQVIRYMCDDQEPHDVFGAVSVQAPRPSQRKPYWTCLGEKALCIVVRRDEMSEDSLKYLSLFSESRRLYVIFLDYDEMDMDGGMGMPFVLDRKQFRIARNSYMLVNAADMAEIYLTQKDAAFYYEKVFRWNVSEHHVRLSKEFAFPRVLQLASSLDKRSICEMMDKIIVYALKDKMATPRLMLKDKDFDFTEKFVLENSSEELEEDTRTTMERELVGMEEVKQQVYDVVNVMKYNKIRRDMNIDGSSYHNVHVMLGAPGTAKTTVAKFMGQLMLEEKLLPSNRAICINGAELKAKFVGHTAPKVKALFQSYDVIVIDEAYSIVDSNGRNDAFSNEAVAQLIVELERHSTDKLVIFAGYGGDVEEKDNRMQGFLDSNPGIKSRITSTFYFKSYTESEMVEIFDRLAQNCHYSLDRGIADEVEEFFADRIHSRDFGNGREARALLETSIVFAAKRVMAEERDTYTAEDMSTLTRDDVHQAILKMDGGFGSRRSEKRAIGF